MCLILLAIERHPHFPLVIAANRDEFFNRPAQPAHFWAGDHRVLAGKDIEAGGTWLGITPGGRFAALTNYRDPANMGKSQQSRGLLPLNYLRSSLSPLEYISKIAVDDAVYNGYNLLMSDDLSRFYHYSNISGESALLIPGIHGLSNHLLNTPWPKVESGRAMLENLVARETIHNEDLFEMLYHKQQAPDEELPDTGIEIELERVLSPMFIRTSGYGTRCSTVITMDRTGRIAFEERTFDADDRILEIKNFSFRIGD
jgi:uncharacterized protein with NRDE domain